jgi:acetylglutamate kinase
VILEDFAAIKSPKILIGGGNIATSCQKMIRYPVQQQIDGRRVTMPTLDILLLAYAGKMYKELSSTITSVRFCNALDTTGADGNSIRSKVRDKNPIDFGYVGDPVAINAKLIGYCWTTISLQFSVRLLH